ncbi:hypothetical protein RHMOL_Rhmol05G0278600 [Rhododendron molle]|uniref:Uncharacterized protein n=1 Tax=Rhododendron molle TaxID=49168 RepID=A0ACC0NTW6_RHOML|nr:hypothetical protein RHMOL_Rhmol05G0278600 [Rhododendron molle]
MVGYGELFDVIIMVPTLVGGIVKVNFVSAPFTTHSFSQRQRLVNLAITGLELVGTTYTIGCTLPPSGNVALSSYYMLFVVNNGVPSIASWIQLIS